jgi:hypothetical protein
VAPQPQMMKPQRRPKQAMRRIRWRFKGARVWTGSTDLGWDRNGQANSLSAARTLSRNLSRTPPKVRVLPAPFLTELIPKP